MLRVGTVAKPPGYVLLVIINFFGTELKSQSNSLWGNPFRPASAILYCWGAYNVRLQMVSMHRGTTLVPHVYYGVGRVLHCCLPFTGRNLFSILL